MVNVLYSEVMRGNILTAFLDLLNVKHTKSFTSKHFNEHPHKYNLYGLSEILSDYGVENRGFKTGDKEAAIRVLKPPFIAHMGGYFTMVTAIANDKVSSLWQGKEISVALDTFLQTWSGVGLLAEANEHSIEPDYKENRKKERIDSLRNFKNNGKNLF